MNDLEPLPPESWTAPAEPWLAPGPDAATGAETAPSSGGRRLKTRSKVLLGGGAIMALIAGGFVAGSAMGATPSTVRFTDAATSQATSAAGPATCAPVFPGSPGRKALAGTVASVDTGHATFAVTTTAAPVNVSVSPTTRYTKTQAGGTVDLNTGAHVLVHGTRATDGTIAAQQIVIVPAAAATAPDGSGRAGSGTIASSNLTNGSGTLTVTVPGGTKTVNVTTVTKIYKTASAAFSDVTSGEPVVVAGKTGAAGSLAAALVAIGQPGQSGPLGAPGPFGRPGAPGAPGAPKGFKVPGGRCGPAAGAAGRNAAAGTVGNLNGGNFTVKSPRGSVKVTTTSATTFSKQIQESATAVTVGSAVVAVGTPSTDGGSIAANQIAVSPVTPRAKAGPRAFGATGAPGARGAARGVVAGTVASNDTSTNTLTVTGIDGTTRTVTYGPTTKVTATVPASISDVKNNGYVVVAGTTGPDGTLSATHVNIGQPVQPGGFGPFGSPGFGRRLAPSAAGSPTVN